MPIIRKLSGKDHKEFFENIYRKYFNGLFAYALVITKSDALAKDIVSDVFFNLWNSKIDLSAVKEIKSYLFTCVKNQAVRELAGNAKDFDAENYKQAVNSIDRINPEELLLGKELDQLLYQTIKELPPHCGLVFKMIKEDKMKYEEIAKELGITTETVKYHLKTALKKIRSKLEDHFGSAKVVKWYTSGSLIILAFSLASLVRYFLN